MKFSRIHITGNAGAGKSTLAKKLGDVLGLPVFGLDKIVWQAGWKKTSKDERLKLELDLIKKREWIIEGVSDQIRRSADLVIFLDRSRSKCFIRCMKRNLPYLFHSRPELPSNCPEILILIKLMQIIWKFPIRVRKKIMAEIKNDNYQAPYILLTSDLDAEKFVNSMVAGYNNKKDADKSL